jgi:glucan phosphoethanolaminetransferase (alkaline phosphatase superfamily)
MLEEFLKKLIEIFIDTGHVVVISSIFFACAFNITLLQRRYKYGFLMFAAGFFLFMYLKGFSSWISSLGSDSFFEARYFNSSEAGFWIDNYFSAISQMRLRMNKTSILLFSQTLFLTIVWSLILWRRPVFLKLLVAIAIISTGYTAYILYKSYELSNSYAANLSRKFDRHPTGFEMTDDIDLFVYIGESTSALNLGIYGYPLETTPRLEKLSGEDKGFLLFDNVRSTHTHTSPSLLDALAIPYLRPDGQIMQWGIGNVLKHSGFNTSLYSAQPISGSFSVFSHYVFEGLITDQMKEDLFKGNYPQPKIKDHQLLEQALSNQGIVFFHSYAGHGHYLDHIETNLSQVVKRPSISFNGMYGSQFSELMDSDLPDQVNDYDQAMTYIDRNIARAIDVIRMRNKPAALIYFSDHGEAVFSKGGHDSSRFIDEMSRVPLIIYFNDAYRMKYPNTYSAYSEAAKSKKYKLLDQISPTILDILRVESDYQIDVPTVASIFRHPRPYMLYRKTLTGHSGIELNYNEVLGFSRANFVGGTPEPTYISIINEHFSDVFPICYHRANSYYMAVRAAALTNCLEFDLVVDDAELNIYHPPTIASGFQINHMFDIAEARKNNLWIDSKNLDDPIACSKLISYLTLNRARVGKILVEFPSKASRKLKELKSCGDGLKTIGVRRSYYVPSHLLLPCAENRKKNAFACNELQENLQRVMDSGIFSDLSFDYLGYPAMKSIQHTRKYKWNTWAIRPQDFHRFPYKDFSFVIMDTSKDPNKY